MHNDEEDRCGSWSDTLRKDEYTNQVQPGDQGVRLQGGWHFSRVSAYNKIFASNVTLRLKQRICQLDLIYILVWKRGIVHCREPIEVLSYKIGVCKVARYDDDDHHHDHGDDHHGDDDDHERHSATRLVFVRWPDIFTLQLYSW